MKKVVVFLNIIIALYFFVLANIYFWGAILSLFADTLVKPELFINPWNLMVNMLIAPFLVYVAIIFFLKTEKKYRYGLVLLFILWAKMQIYGFVFVTNQKLDLSDLSNFALFAIPFSVIYLTQQLNKKNTKAQSIS